MAAEPLLPAEQNKYYPKTQKEQGSQSHHTLERDKPRDSWSLRGFLSRHVSRRYRVLEREPNRLRKRFTN
ncbi:hypothetical protein BDV26DRAFT_260860 [Aspergillus bertholletiae]|uniref:Uncharacterized protein n=1 Tax=Aspergillus bertholletiae TaxID=1226010 RepID=A0A5N7BAH5_9EURO|nr:hypothetical protein BDV26DRAFT_260860 [Aspergillus bertholletiae]